MELLEWLELSVAVVSERVISGSAIAAVGVGGPLFIASLTLARKTTVIKGKNG